MAKHHPKFGEHGTFLKMNHIEENFGRVPMLPHHAADGDKKLHPKHHHII